MKKTKVTAKDVAKYAGVSATTVSMVLSGKSERRFPEKTCRRILDACSELGYVRNHTAVNIAEEKTLAANHTYAFQYVLCSHGRVNAMAGERIRVFSNGV